jgi:hypothetical protein
MALVAGWTDRVAHGRPWWRRRLLRLAGLFHSWQRRLARRRFVGSVLTQTADPAILADIGIEPADKRHVERWIMAMLWHQH